MKVFYNINDYEPSKNTVVTTGTFDGVHLGHKTIINRLKEIAKKVNGTTTLLTFHPHPRMVLFPNNTDLKLLNTQQEKIELLEKAGIDNLIIHPFTKEFSRLSSIDFVRDILVNKLKTHKLVIGYDHRFGRNREGTFNHLKEFGHLYGFNVEEIPAKEVDDINISSTKIRHALLSGDIRTANKYLGYNFSISGNVVAGNKLGRTLGFPTANIIVNDLYKIIPQDGAYCVKIVLDKQSFSGMINIGNKPTVNSSKTKSIEAHIFNFNENLYNKTLTINFICKLRNEQKFNSIEELTSQLEKDKINSLEIIERESL